MAQGAPSDTCRLAPLAVAMDGRPEGRPSSAPRTIPARPPALALPRASDDGDGSADALPNSVEAIAFATSPLSAKVRAKWEARASDGGGDGAGSFGGARASLGASPRAELAARLAAAQARRNATIAWVMGRARRLRRAPPLRAPLEAAAGASFADDRDGVVNSTAASPRTPGPPLSPHEAWLLEGSGEGAFARRCAAREAPGKRPYRASSPS